MDLDPSFAGLTVDKYYKTLNEQVEIASPLAFLRAAYAALWDEPNTAILLQNLDHRSTAIRALAHKRVVE